MNTVDENAQEAPEAAAEEAIETPPHEPEKEPDKKKGKSESTAVVAMFFFIGFCLSIVVGWWLFPKLLYSQKKQPVDFNHAIHNQLVDQGCESCHFFREDGTFAGVPELAQCIECHEEANGVDPQEIKFVEEYVVKEREVPWLIYSKQPDCVFFSHVAHVKEAKMDCVTCHGDIGETDHLKIYEENRITGYSRDIWGKNIAGLKRNSWDRMKMDDCAECHETLARENANVKSLPWPLNWMPRVWDFTGGKKTSVQTEKDACFVCHK